MKGKDHMLKKVSFLVISVLVASAQGHAMFEEGKDDNLKGSVVKKIYEKYVPTQHKASFKFKNDERNFEASFYTKNGEGGLLEDRENLVDSCWKGLNDNDTHKGTWNSKENNWIFLIPAPQILYNLSYPLELTISIVK